MINKAEAMKESKLEWKAHVVVLPSYCPVAIFLTRSMAIDYAEKSYGDWQAKNIKVRVATKKDVECLL